MSPKKVGSLKKESYHLINSHRYKENEKIAIKKEK